jgi:phospholipid-binding lipoprotein MlaA
MSKSVFTPSRRYPSGPLAFTWGQIISDALFLRPWVLGLAMSSLLACAQVAQQNPCDSALTEVHDPIETINRNVFGFNQVLDGYVLKPVARGYRALPDFVQSGVHNFVGNFAEPKVLINDLLQGNLHRSGNTIARFTFNTTFGLLGFIDVATPMGLARHSADFGQTLGVWGLANGPVVELPLSGSHNTRDSAGMLLSFLVDPFGSGNSDTVDAVSRAQGVGGAVDGRAEALPLTDTLQTQPDYYRALRDSTAMRRAQKVAEGKTGAIGPEAPHACPLP